MQGHREAVLAAVLAGVIGATSASAQTPDGLKDFGAPVYPALEGWYNNPDGTATIMVGFFNRNQEETVDLPVGELNHFTPGPADRGQPTHFPPGRSWGVLTVQVPGDFDGDLTWTLTANNQPATISLHLRPPYFIEPFKDAANGNEPPTIRFAPNGEGFTGPPVGITHTLTASVGAPVELSVWLSDVKPEAAEGRGGGRGGRGVDAQVASAAGARPSGVRRHDAARQGAGRPESDDDRHVQRARRVPASGRGARLDRCGRRRVPVLLDVGHRAGHRVRVGASAGMKPSVPATGFGAARDFHHGPARGVDREFASGRRPFSFLAGSVEPRWV